MLQRERPRWLVLLGGPLSGTAVYVALTRLAPELSPEGRAVAGIATWMAIWWIGEALPLAATSLLPLIAFPLSGVTTLERAAAPYADKNVFLFMGGFLIAVALERSHLHRRLALSTLLVVGTGPRRLVGGVMLVTAGLSMWISNTATAAMMLPIGMSLVGLLGGVATTNGRSAGRSPHTELNSEAARRLAACLMLAIAYSASIGGTMTLIGTPTNLLLSGYAANNGIPISFARWMAFAVPMATVYLAVAWWLLTRYLFPLTLAAVPESSGWVREQLDDMGSMSQAERRCLLVFGTVCALWILREPITSSVWLCEACPPLSRLDDTSIALVGALTLFILPAYRNGARLLDAQAVLQLPWGILLLFGGGFSLAASIRETQLDQWLGSQLTSFREWPAWALLLLVVGTVLAATELTSNTPTLAAFLPVAASLEQAVGAPRFQLLIPVTIAASCAFMLPVATPPNAIVFGSGYVTMRQMVRAGVWLNIIGLLWIPLYCLWMVPHVFPQ